MYETLEHWKQYKQEKTKKIKYKFELSPTQIKVLEQKGYKFKKQKL